MNPQLFALLYFVLWPVSLLALVYTTRFLACWWRHRKHYEVGARNRYLEEHRAWKGRTR